MRRIAPFLLIGLLLLPAVSAVAADYEEPDIEFFYPVVTRRPVVERELEFSLEYEKNDEGRQIELAAALEWVLLPRWQVEIEFPLVILDSDHGSTTSGLGDIEIDNKVLPTSRSSTGCPSPPASSSRCPPDRRAGGSEASSRSNRI
jgi:hypothetical protein